MRSTFGKIFQKSLTEAVSVNRYPNTRNVRGLAEVRQPHSMPKAACLSVPVLFSLPSVTLIHSYQQPACFFDAHSALGFVSLRDTLRLNCPSLIKIHLGREQVRLPSALYAWFRRDVQRIRIGPIGRRRNMLCYGRPAAEPPRNGVCQSCNRAR